eukprot:TRINITY_DN98648_c0_g1_i1.p1 TRINITY_DN98648_c0_g1~~TRINITY_DN98648_c0_g1_i1.p1  ORF type:complete len:282 (-),score=65.14 TRINITY_DN98648_c0_g1_i1:448-1293(-)
MAALGVKEDELSLTLPSKAPDAMPRKQARILSTGDAKLVEGLEPTERQRVLTEAMIRRKEERCCKTRCPKCWFPLDSSGTSYCVCARMPALGFTRRTKFLIYIHPRDYYNAGDDAKIFLCAAPDDSQIFVFGRPGDDERLRSTLEEATAPLLLFPDSSAISVTEFLSDYRKRSSKDESLPDDHTPEVTAVVIDGTWNNVKQMQKHFSRTVAPHVPHIKLEPTSLSVYARTQTRKDGISSVEAMALLLRELGEDPKVCDTLVDYLVVNNEALKLKPATQDDD